MYNYEIRDFLKAITGKQSFPYSFDEDQKIINTLRVLEKSANIRKMLKV